MKPPPLPKAKSKGGGGAGGSKRGKKDDGGKKDGGKKVGGGGKSCPKPPPAPKPPPKEDWTKCDGFGVTCNCDHHADTPCEVCKQSAMVGCEKCGLWMHMGCVGIMTLADIPEKW